MGHKSQARNTMIRQAFRYVQELPDLSITQKGGAGRGGKDRISGNDQAALRRRKRNACIRFAGKEFERCSVSKEAQMAFGDGTMYRLFCAASETYCDYRSCGYVWKCDHEASCSVQRNHQKLSHPVRQFAELRKLDKQQ